LRPYAGQLIFERGDPWGLGTPRDLPAQGVDGLLERFEGCDLLD